MLLASCFLRTHDQRDPLKRSTAPTHGPSLIDCSIAFVMKLFAHQVMRQNFTHQSLTNQLLRSPLLTNQAAEHPRLYQFLPVLVSQPSRLLFNPSLDSSLARFLFRCVSRPLSSRSLGSFARWSSRLHGILPRQGPDSLGQPARSQNRSLVRPSATYNGYLLVKGSARCSDYLLATGFAPVDNLINRWPQRSARWSNHTRLQQSARFSNHSPPTGGVRLSSALGAHITR